MIYFSCLVTGCWLFHGSSLNGLFFCWFDKGFCWGFSQEKEEKEKGSAAEVTGISENQTYRAAEKGWNFNPFYCSFLLGLVLVYCRKFMNWWIELILFFIAFMWSIEFKRLVPWCFFLFVSKSNDVLGVERKIMDFVKLIVKIYANTIHNKYKTYPREKPSKDFETGSRFSQGSFFRNSKNKKLIKEYTHISITRDIYLCCVYPFSNLKTLHQLAFDIRLLWRKWH